MRPSKSLLSSFEASESQVLVLKFWSSGDTPTLLQATYLPQFHFTIYATASSTFTGSLGMGGGFEIYVIILRFLSTISCQQYRDFEMEEKIHLDDHSNGVCLQGGKLASAAGPLLQHSFAAFTCMFNFHSIPFHSMRRFDHWGSLFCLAY